MYLHIPYFCDILTLHRFQQNQTYSFQIVYTTVISTYFFITMDF